LFHYSPAQAGTAPAQQAKANNFREMLDQFERAVNQDRQSLSARLYHGSPEFNEVQQLIQIATPLFEEMKALFDNVRHPTAGTGAGANPDDDLGITLDLCAI
jgi:hypothetical protein